MDALESSQQVGDRDAQRRSNFRERRRAWILRAGKDLRPLTNGVIARYSEIGNPVVFDPALFPWIAELEAGWTRIRAEAECILLQRDRLPGLHEISPDHRRLNRDGRWKSFILYGYGIRSDRNCARCPDTANLLQRVPGLETAFFSILAPGVHLKKHRGPTKAIFTYHLGLIVPEPRERCYIELEGNRHLWREGKSLVFDDTWQHQVRNDTDRDRVVLLLHVRRPVRFPGSLVSSLFLRAIKASPFIRDAHRNQQRWEARFEAATRQHPLLEDEPTARD